MKFSGLRFSLRGFATNKATALSQNFAVNEQAGSKTTTAWLPHSAPKKGAQAAAHLARALQRIFAPPTIYTYIATAPPPVHDTARTIHHECFTRETAADERRRLLG